MLIAIYSFKTRMGRMPNLKNPQSFNEKLFWLMLYWRHPLKSYCADKYAVRSYVKEHGFGHILPELVGVYEKSSEIDFDTLPERFVLKCTHGCGFHIICKNKSELDWEEAKRKLDAWMKVDISKFMGEIHYALIQPRIICECYLDDLSGDIPIDYKVYCFAGHAHCTLVVSERSSGSKKLDVYDREWRHKLPYTKSNLQAKRQFRKPAGYETMIEAAERLSKPFPFVRVDFYSINGKAVIGEMTFTPAGCSAEYLTGTAEKILGQMVELPPKNFFRDSSIK